MIARGRKNVLGVAVSAMDYEAVVEDVVRAAREQTPLAVSALAVHGVMTGALDRTHRYRLNHLDHLVPDGQPVRWALNLLHRAELPDRVYGPTLMLRVCDRAAADGLPIYLYGSRPDVVSTLRARLEARIPGLRVAGAEPSRFRTLGADEKAQVVRTIRESGARIVFVGLGCPRQEVWAYEYRDALGLPVLAVGAAFDFHAGTLPQAPPLLQRLGLEWVFRLIQEPRRLWRRYLYFNTGYTAMVAAQALRLRRFDPGDAVAPSGEVGYG